MFLKSTFATLMLAGLYCPLAPAKYNDSFAFSPAMTKVEFQKTVVVSDYTTPSKENEAEEQDQVGGADLTPAVWYHSLDAPVVFSDVAYHHHKHRRSKKKSAAIVGGSAATGAVIGGLAGGGKGAVAGGLIGGGAGYVYDHNTKKK